MLRQEKSWLSLRHPNKQKICVIFRATTTTTTKMRWGGQVRGGAGDEVGEGSTLHPPDLMGSFGFYPSYSHEK